MHLRTLAPIAVSLSLGSAASAEVGPGISVGLRTGWALPAGQIETGDRMSSTYSAMVPIGIDGAYRITPRFRVGLSGQYALVSTSEVTCQPPLECSAHQWRFGPMASFHPASPARYGSTSSPLPVDPWVGLGVGYEILSIGLSSSGRHSTRTESGFDLDVSMGLDWRAAERLRLGGLIGVSIGQFSRVSIDQSAGPDYSGRIPSASMHEWFFFGIRGQYDL